MNPIQLGKFLSELRNEKNLTQEELANKLYIDKRKVSRWECGTSIPDFDLLINISKILDVSLYELSICQRVKDEKINEKLINKFKSIKDIKKYKTKQKVKLVLKIIFVIISLFAITYTIINQGSVEIYRIISNSENYKIDGSITRYKDNIIFTITSIITNNNVEKNELYNECAFEVYNEKTRILLGKNNNYTIYMDSSLEGLKIDRSFPSINEKYTIHFLCDSNKDKNNETDEYSFYLEKKYNNRIF